MILQSVHYIDKKNTGDIQSCPLEHFKTHAEIKKFHIYDIDKIDKDIPLIIGGGGLLQQGKSRDNIGHIINTHRAPIILWAVGFNTNNKRSDDFAPEFIYKASLHGIRDYGLDGIKYVPCVSCLHPSLNKKYEIKKDIVCFEGNKLNLPFPTMGCGNGRPMEEIIEFLGTAKTIITSSYHGMYWGTLLGREVIVIPNEHSSKFYYFPVSLPHATINNWHNFIGTGNIYPEFLQNCRSININFSQSVQQIISIKLSPKQ